jgi:hypothetical protein
MTKSEIEETEIVIEKISRFRIELYQTYKTSLKVVDVTVSVLDDLICSFRDDLDEMKEEFEYEMKMEKQ